MLNIIVCAIEGVRTASVVTDLGWTPWQEAMAHDGSLILPKNVTPHHHKLSSHIAN